MTDVAIPRDRWGRPLIVPPEGGKAQPYTRASTMAKVLDDLNQLLLWGSRKTAEGLVRRPDLITKAAGILANGDPNEDYQTKKALNEVCAEAKEAAGSSRGASAGTGFHQLTEALDRGEDVWPWVHGDDAVRLEAYRTAVQELTPLDAEVFVVCDDLRAAGSFDRLWRLSDGRVVVGDLKTGKSEADYPLSTTTQIAVYANSLRYDAATGERSPLHPDLDKSVGLLIHMPPSGGCRVIPLDLAKGWEAAMVAANVKNTIRAWKPKDLILDSTLTLSEQEKSA